MHIHILGICGTFMGSLALLARQMGHRVTGSDANVYPPMSTQLAQQGIEIWQGYEPEQLQPAPDLIIVGNAMGRGNPAVEYMLNAGLPYSSGPQWLGEQLLAQCHVLAVSGTHGKTTTSAMLAWILEDNGLKPGYLIGGVPGNFNVSADIGGGDYFVIEADEYDTAFFDKRSKFVHYHCRTLVLNNLEYDHADIFPDLQSIQQQFHHLLRTVPGEGQIIAPAADDALEEVIEQGCWTPVSRFSLTEAAHWSVRNNAADGSRFDLVHAGDVVGEVCWGLLGDHNVANALAAVAAAYAVGVKPADAAASLCRFKGVKRRLELLGRVNGVTVYDDFAHHPTAIRTTLAGLAKRKGSGRLLAVLEPRSNTMKLGVHREALQAAVADADLSFWLQAQGLEWDLADYLDMSAGRQRICATVDAILEMVRQEAREGDQIVIMSNGGFQGIHQRLLDELALVPEVLK